MAITMAVVMMLLGGSFTGFGVSPSYGAGEKAADYPNYVDRQIVVVFDDDVDRASAADIVAFALSEEMISEKRSSTGGIKGIRESLKLTKIKTDDNMMRVDFKAGVNVKAAAKEIARNPDVAYAQPNYIYTLSKGGSGGTEYDREQYLKFVDAAKARRLLDKQKENGKVTVALLDTGVSENDEALKGVDAVSTNRDEASDRHGTEMAGLVAKTAGKNNVKLLAVDVCDGNGSYGGKTVTTTTDIVAGIDYASKHDAQIVAMAFGRHGYDNALAKKMKRAAKGDILFIAAGDNDAEAIWYPADYKSCMSSKATDKISPDYGAAVTAGTAAMVMRADAGLSAVETRAILAKAAKGKRSARKAVSKALK